MHTFLSVLSRFQHTLLVAACTGMLLACALQARAQCPEHWLSGSGTPNLGLGGEINTMVLLPNGDLVVGGDFTTAGGVNIGRGTARYNRSTDSWSALGTGTSGIVDALAVLSNGDIVAGGNFTFPYYTIGSDFARYSFSTNTWSPLNNVLPPFFLGLTTLYALPDGSLLAGCFSNEYDNNDTQRVVCQAARYSLVTNTWSSFGPKMSNSTGSAMVDAFASFPDGRLLFAGAFETAGGIPANNIAVFDPTTGQSSLLGAGTNGTVYAVDVLPSGDVIAAGSFTTAGGISANHVARYNPTTKTWSALGTGVPDPVRSNCLAHLPNGDVVVFGRYANSISDRGAYVTRYNFANDAWSMPGGSVPIASGTYVQSGAIAVFSNGDFVIGGAFETSTNYIKQNPLLYSTATNTWSSLGSNPDQAVFAFAPLPDGDVLVGGGFTMAGGMVVNHIARYNPTLNTWSAFGPGFNGDVYAILPLPNGDVIVGGQFELVGAVHATNLARYTKATDTWSSSMSIYQLRVQALALLQDGTVLVGGYFSIVGANTPAQNIARYNLSTNTWSTLGSGVNQYGVTGLLVLPDGDVVVTGVFLTAGDVMSPCIARYSPVTNTWSDIDSGVNGERVAVYSCVRLSDGDLVVAGLFDMAGNVPVQNIARYHPATNTWAAMGSIPDFSIAALARLPNDDLIGAGSFSTIGGIAANNIAHYHMRTQTWSPLGSGLSQQIGTALVSAHALAVLPSGELLVGGSFGFADGKPSACFARYDFGNSLCPTDFNCSGKVDIADIFAFLRAWFAKSDAADFNHDASTNVSDIFTFLRAWFVKCE